MVLYWIIMSQNRISARFLAQNTAWGIIDDKVQGNIRR